MLRESKGLSKAELGRMTGVTGPAVKAWEDPGRYPEAEKLPLIADALGCSIDALFGHNRRLYAALNRLDEDGMSLLLNAPEAINALASSFYRKLDQAVLNGWEAATDEST